MEKTILDIAISASNAIITSIINTYIMPNAKIFIDRSIGKSHFERLLEKIDKYCNRKFNKLSFIDTLVFPNKQTLLNTLYEPLQLVQSGNLGVRVVIDSYPKKIMEEFQRIIIIDTAGMGKSTLLRKIFLSVIRGIEKFPIFIELRNISPNNSIERELRRQFEIDETDAKQWELFNWFISLNNLVFLFDGLDEIPMSNREFVISRLHEFIMEHQEGDMIITSRPEDVTLSFGSFMKFQIEPLTILEAYSLIHKYDVFNTRKIADDLIIALGNQQNKSLFEFLKVPFLVSLIYKSFDYKKEVPLRKSEFYKQVFDALFDSHDLSKEGWYKRIKYSGLSLDEFDRVLRHVAYFSMTANEVEYSKDKITAYIDKSKAYIDDLKFDATEFLRDLLNTVPLFREDGIKVKWAHKSLQDYFAAKFIWVDSKQQQELILKKIYQTLKFVRFDISF